MADSDYNMDWQPKPLVDTSKPPISNPTNLEAAKKPPVPGQPDLEAKLKPAEPFIHDVESKLSIQPKPGVTLVERLNNLQTVLFGTTQYQDARELLSKLAEIFPQEAAKAQASLNQELQNTLPHNDTSSSSAQPNAGKAPHPTVSMATPGTNGMNPPAMPYYGQPQAYNPAQPPQQAIIKPKKKHFWQQDDWDSDFKNDPFFQDDHINNSQQPAPSKLSALGQGMAGIAMMAGSLAGAYYLNKKIDPTNNQPYYSNDPYYPGYGYPYYGAYGYGGGYPYGYYNGYGSYGAYPPPAGAYGSPYGGIITSRPYSPYYSNSSGSSSFGSVSPLGVPTGF
jgi:hypothetical protein